MKKIIALFLVLCMMPVCALAANSDTTIVLRIGDPYMTVNGAEAEIDPGRGTAPVIVDGRTLVPLRAIMEALGGSAEPTYYYMDGVNNDAILVRLYEKYCLISIGSGEAVTLNTNFGVEEAMTMEVAPVIINDRTMLPARQIMEYMGCTVEWDGRHQSVTITKKAFADKVAGTVNGEPLYLSDYNVVYAPIANAYSMFIEGPGWKSRPTEDGRSFGEYVRDDTVRSVVLLMVANQKAAEYGIDIAGPAVESSAGQKRNALIEAYGGESSYNETLCAYHTTDEASKRRALGIAVADELLAVLSAEGGPCYASADEAGYNDDNFTRARHILISTSIHDEAEALLMANEVISRLDAGEDFAALIEEYNDDPGMDYYDSYVFVEGEMVDAFYQGARVLETGQYSPEPVRSAHGYHIIQRLPLEDGSSDAASEKQKELIDNKVQEKFLALLEQWAAEAEIHIDYDIIDAALEDQQ